MSNLKIPTTAHDVLDNSERQYKALKTNMITRRTDFLAGGTGRDVLSLIAFLKGISPPLQLVIDTPGISDLAKAKYSDETYDIVANLTDLLSKITSAIDEIVALIPKSGADYMLLMSMSVENVPVWRTFTLAQLVPLIEKLDEIIAIID